MKIFMYVALFVVVGYCAYEVNMEEIKIMMELKNVAR